MTSKQKTVQNEKKARPTTAKASRTQISAEEKCQAVLSLWSERRRPSELCRDLGIQWGSLNAWQNKALSAMMEALTPRTRKDEERGPTLGPKLERLLAKTSQKQAKAAKLGKRLEHIQSRNKEE